VETLVTIFYIASSDVGSFVWFNDRGSSSRIWQLWNVVCLSSRLSNLSSGFSL